MAFGLIRCGDFHILKVIPYSIAQVAGAAIGAFINLTIFETVIKDYELAHSIVRGTPDSIKSANTFGDYYMLSPYAPTRNMAIFIEAFGTAFLVFCIFAVTHPRNRKISPTAVPFVIGSAIAVMVSTLGPLTGSGINPGKHLCAKGFNHHVYKKKLIVLLFFFLLLRN